jgi:hypothetical protein
MVYQRKVATRKHNVPIISSEKYTKLHLRSCFTNEMSVVWVALNKTATRTEKLPDICRSTYIHLYHYGHRNAYRSTYVCTIMGTAALTEVHTSVPLWAPQHSPKYRHLYQYGIATLTEAHSLYHYSTAVPTEELLDVNV